MELARDFAKKYSQWVLENPQRTSEIETGLKWISYFLSGRGVYYSNLLSELVYTTSNLLTVLNDDLIAQAYDIHFQRERSHTIKTWIVVIEYAEVFLELTALKFWGKKGKWAIVTLIQIFKAAARAVLLITHKESLLGSPAILPLKRQEVIDSENDFITHNTGTFQLGSGRLIRSVNSGVSTVGRSWVPPTPHNRGSNDNSRHKNSGFDRKLRNKYHVMAEISYIIKPVAHLWSMHQYGQYSWRPWLISLLMEFPSLHALRHDLYAELTSQQKIEVIRRVISLFVYLVRSPLYDAQSKYAIRSLLVGLSKSLPLVRFIFLPMKESIHEWQKVYFYLWSR